MKTEIIKLPFLNFLAKLLIFVSFSVIISCNGDDDDEDRPAPLFPDDSTFIIDFSVFTTADTIYLREIESFNNFGRALTNIAFWDSIISFNLEVPAAAFHGVSKEHGIYDPTIDYWVWAYPFAVQSDFFRAKLHAWLVEDGVQWGMYVTSKGDYYDFFWFTGVSETNLHEGMWLVYLDPENWEPYIDINWGRNDQTNQYEIEYKYVLYQHPEENSFIQVSYKNEENYDCSATVFWRSQNRFVYVDWDTESKTGRIKEPDYFGDSDWHCWNSYLLDVDCP